MWRTILNLDRRARLTMLVRTGLQRLQTKVPSKEVLHFLTRQEFLVLTWNLKLVI